MPDTSLCEDRFIINHLRHSHPEPIHPPHPFHWLLRFKLLGDAFGGSVVFDQPKEKSVGLFFDVSKVRAELDGGFQVGIEDETMFPEIAREELTPYANGTIRAVIGDI